MRCKACDSVLNDFEQSRKYLNGEDLLLCNSCYSQNSSEYDVTANLNLMSDADDIIYQELDDMRYIVDNISDTVDDEDNYYDL